LKKITHITAAISAMTLILSATPTFAAQHPTSSVIQNAQATLNLDQNVMKRLTDAITELAGKQTIHFTTADTSFDDWTVNGTVKGTANAESLQTYDTLKGRVVSTTLVYNATDINKIMDNALRLKIAAFLKTFDKDQIFEPDAIWRVKDLVNEGGFKNYWVIWGPNQSLYIDLDNKNQISASMNYKIKDVQAVLTNKARNSLKTLGIHSIKPFDYVLLTKNGNDSLWKYRDDNNLNHVFIGSVTGKVWKVTNELGIDWNGDADFDQSFAKPKLSKIKALSIATPKAKSIFGINLKGYAVTIKDNEYTFTKKGAPTLVGTINKKGVFYSFEVLPLNGARN